MRRGAELDIDSILAGSPQAKGRIERLWGTFQDRLVVELRLAGVVDRPGANAFLAVFLPRYNARFAVPALDPVPAWRTLPDDVELDRVLGTTPSPSAAWSSSYRPGRPARPTMPAGGSRSTSPSMAPWSPTMAAVGWPSGPPRRHPSSCEQPRRHGSSRASVQHPRRCRGHHPAITLGSGSDPAASSRSD